MAVPKKPVKKKPSPKKKARVAKRAEKKETRVAKRKVKKATRAEKNAPTRKKSAGNYAAVKKGGGTGKKAGGGMTAKGVAAYRKANPGSKLKTAVTGKPKAGSKDAGRRKSFCARSRSWKSERGLAARRKWNC
jgi:outer membrane biosynthesis protein TonB